jgi:hypothetical protein
MTTLVYLAFSKTTQNHHVSIYTHYNNSQKVSFRRNKKKSPLQVLPPKLQAGETPIAARAPHISPHLHVPHHTEPVIHNQEKRYLIISQSNLLKRSKYFHKCKGGLFLANIYQRFRHTKKLPITVLYTYF